MRWFYALREAALKHFPGTFTITRIERTFVCAVTCSVRTEIVYVKTSNLTMFNIECKSEECDPIFYGQLIFSFLKKEFNREHTG